ncbi:MAG: thiamine pyrophosphate-binding protein [SAR324 cluster bacterium]|nr:thiamine pyrophosphate-binding protein [SAR324 cluster bacterium]MDP7501706.1 thiamine pyrophosphate-binding protein [SAR324 cluster bacterium]
MPSLTGAEAIVKSLQQNGVDTIFGLPGGQLDHLFDAIYKTEGKIKLIHSRHEQGAAYMAFGYARSTGQLGTYTVVPGPGLLNTTAALCTAYACNTPVLCLTGQIPSGGIGTGRGYLHEIPDQLGLIQKLTKWAARIEHPTQAPDRVREALKQLQTGRPRPVELEMAMDMMGEQSEVSLLPPESHTALAPDSGQIELAAKQLCLAKRPMFVVGGGAQHASSEVLRLAEMLQAPVTFFRSGKGVIDERHYLSQSFPAGHRLWTDADVVLAIGTRLKYQQMYWGLDKNLKILRIDIDPIEMNRISTPEIGIVADARIALEALLTAVESHNIPRPSRREELNYLKTEFQEAFEDKIAPQMGYLRVIRDELPEDGFFVDEVTQVGFASWYAFPTYHPRHFISAGYQGTLGYGYATALGVQAAHPDKKVISIAGDGGFMFNVQELATAVQFRLGVVVIIFNDSKFGNVQRQQKEWFGGRIIASNLLNPDFVQLAESFGLAGYRVRSPDELRPVLQRALADSEPALIEVVLTEDMPSPWPFILTPRARPV